jgi:hypothetical protein
MHDRGQWEAAQASTRPCATFSGGYSVRSTPDTLITRHNIALLMRARGEWDEAQVECQAVLATRQRVLGDEHPYTLITQHALALLLQARGDWDEAQAEYVAVLAIRQRVLGDNHPNTLTTGTRSPGYCAIGVSGTRRKRSTWRCSLSGSGRSATTTPIPWPPSVRSPRWQRARHDGLAFRL